MNLTQPISGVSHAQRPREYSIEVNNLVKTYDTVRAVEGVNLRVEKGQIYALLGPNGAGKTTTINILTTLVLPTSGNARVAGLDVVKQAAEVRRRIGVTFQETVLDKSLSGRVLLDVHGRLYQLPKAEIKTRTEELVKMVELEEAIDRPVKTYSGGMKRRLELARGLMTHPEVLFLDEPTLGLDPQNRDRIWVYIERLKIETGLTILVTTHYMDEAEKLADRVGIIDGGKIVAEGTPTELIGAMGADVVKVSGTGGRERFVEALQRQEWVSFVGTLQLDATTLVQDVQIGLKTQAGRSLKPIIDLAEKCEFSVVDISIKRPSLNDVFLKHTGRRLRD
ncbi:MAG: ATP-binding cassette domain-containing protein [Chloroflexota bacterium]|nr:ATP-binding cassette domain-containing protein [Chloroflexota bacterium]